MENKKIVVSLFGYSCAGKSAAAKVLKKKYQGVYTLDFDVQKRQFSGYQSQLHREYIEKLLLSFFDMLCKTGVPILLLATPFKNEGEYDAYEKIAAANGYDIASFEFTAPVDVLVERYRERLQAVKDAGSVISIRTEAEFLETLDVPYFLPANTLTVDSSKLSPEAISEAIDSTVSNLL